MISLMCRTSRTPCRSVKPLSFSFASLDETCSQTLCFIIYFPPNGRDTTLSTATLLQPTSSDILRDSWRFVLLSVATTAATDSGLHLALEWTAVHRSSSFISSSLSVSDTSPAASSSCYKIKASLWNNYKIIIKSDWIHSAFFSVGVEQLETLSFWWPGFVRRICLHSVLGSLSLLCCISQKVSILCTVLD